MAIATDGDPPGPFPRSRTLTQSDLRGHHLRRDWGIPPVVFLELDGHREAECESVSDASSLEIEPGGSRDLPLRIRSLRLGRRDEATHDSGDGDPGRCDNEFAFSDEGGRQFREFLNGFKEAPNPLATTATGTFKARISQRQTRPRSSTS